MSIQKLRKSNFLGKTINDVKGMFNKINEIIDWLSGVGIAGAGSYKKYVALLTQSGTSAPVATVLEDTIGTITFEYSSEGNYNINSTAKFTSGKTVIFLGASSQDTDQGLFQSEAADSNQLHIRTWDFNSGLNEFAMVNGKLVATSIEIRVYN